jgi:NAD(P)-dependent dehydrogenase (short-subunit alcohol dehydrogenase family)
VSRPFNSSSGLDVAGSQDSRRFVLDEKVDVADRLGQQVHCFLAESMYYRRFMSGPDGKVVLVTGGGSGLGKALAAAFAREGHRVAICGRSEDRLSAAAEQLSRAGAEVFSFRCDVGEKADVQQLADAIHSRWGNVQILINNAGTATAAAFLEMPDSLWHDTLKTNLTGAYNCCKVFLPGMLESRWGRIINIGSTTSKVGYSHVAAYVASKHGLLGLTRVLALETARAGVTVNAICPGYLDDELTHANARRMAETTGKPVEHVLSMFAKSAPQQRLIPPAEVAELALLIASNKLSAVTGQAISIDGGATMM